MVISIGRKFIDLTGQKFDKLTVLEFAGIDKHGNSKWFCKCDCGNDKNIIVIGRNLKSGVTKNCGCNYRKYPKDLTGLKFGKLTVIKRDGKIRNRPTWLCQCDCENKTLITVIADALRSGNKDSCGCLTKIKQKNAKEKYNKYNLTGEYGIGYTPQGEEFYFDLEDYDKIKDYCWHYDNKGYVFIRKNGLTIRQHRLIMNAEDSEEVDHILHIKHDNRKSELRLVDRFKNCCNRELSSINTSGYKGVSWNKRYGKWFADITVNKKRIRLGYFDNIADAVKARKEAEEKYQGEYSYDNSINKNKEVLERLNETNISN